MAQDDLAATLTRSRLFSGLTAAELRPLAARSRARVLNAGERITGNDDIFVVSHGLMKVTGTLNASALSWLIPADGFFGGIDARTRRKVAIEGVAVTPTALISIPQPVFERFAAERPGMLRAALHALAEKLHEEREFRALMHLPSSDRMLAALVFLYKGIGAKIPLTRAAIAEMTGLARETSIRSLSPYEKRGIIRTRRGIIEILKPGELQDALVHRLEAL